MRDVAHEGAERRRAAKSDQQLRERELSDVIRERRQHVAAGQRQRAAGRGPDDAAPVREPAHHHAAEAEAHHGERERQRCLAACHAEVGLHRGQRNDKRPHADAADGAERERRCEPQPRAGGVDLLARARARGGGVRAHLGLVSRIRSSQGDCCMHCCELRIQKGH